MTAAATPSSVVPAGGFVVRPAHLETLVSQLSQASHSRVIAVHLPGSWAGGDELRVGGQPWRVVRAASVLAVREALADHEEAGGDARLVLLTPLEDQRLGWDVLARVARQRVWQLQPWDLLRDLFRARSVDPRVTSLGWLADVLLEQAPAAGYAPAPSGVLDLDTAWTQALGVLLGLPSGAPDALTLLRMSARESAVARWGALAPEVRRGIVERFEETAGTLGRSLAAALEAGQGDRLVALGLVCDVLWPGDGGTERAGGGQEAHGVRDAIADARVRLEPLVGGIPPASSVARDWAEQAKRVLAELPAPRADGECRAAEAVLSELRAETCVELSRVLPSAASRRAARLGRAIGAWLSGGGALDEVEVAHAALLAHADVAADDPRAERATMALRLVRALASPTSAADESGFAALVRQHVRLGSWTDAARTALLGGDVEGQLAGAYAGLLRRARGEREQDNRGFAERLVAWNAHPGVDPDVLPVEHVIERIVAPVADTRPVLVVLADGLDLVVWRQLHGDLASRGWTWWHPEAGLTAPMGVATLPSLTSCSRATLFAGVPKRGSQATERPDFAAHPALRRSMVNGRAPVLFHKGELGAGNALAADVRRAVSDRQQRVVGVVVNAVDDWLDRSDQVLPRWSVGAVPLLDALLQEAAQAGRAVIVLSDHGHLLDHETTLRSGGESARWRLPASGAPGEGEVLAQGARVRAVTGHDAVVLAWNETLRYTGKKTGYHGGASPQEVVAPIAVLSRDELGLAGWRPMVDAAPAWWSGDIATVAGLPRHAAAAPAHAIDLPRPAPERSAPAESRASDAAPAPAWVGALLASPVYVSQRELAGRTAPRDEQLRVVLETLAQYQGQAPRAAIAAALGVPEIRVRGVIAGVRRVLNVEGFAVLEEEESTGTLRLNRALMRVQFGLGE